MSRYRLITLPESASGAASALPLAALELRHGVRWSPWRDGDGRVRDVLGQEVMPAGPPPAGVHDTTQAVGVDRVAVTAEGR